MTADEVWQTFKRINKVYRQACVIFNNVPLGPNQHAELNVHYDTVSAAESPNDGVLGGAHEIDEVHTAVANASNSSSPACNVNIAIVRSLRLGAAGFTGGSSPEVSYMAHVNFENNGASTFQCSCAHEVGHQLTLSTEKKAGPLSPTDFTHDIGPFPFDRKGKKWEGLMKEVGDDNKEWLRQQDWKAANEKANKMKGTP